MIDNFTLFLNLCAYLVLVARVSLGKELNLVVISVDVNELFLPNVGIVL